MPIEGPRSLRPGEMPALRALEQKVFRPSMPDEYPQVFNERNYDDLTVCFDGGRCVSHVGMVRRSAIIKGCQIDLGLIGGVATDPDYRGQGLAGLCCDYAFDRARRLGLDLLLVSGDRSLYQRRDCVTVGYDFEVTIDNEVVRKIETLPEIFHLPPVKIRTMCESDLNIMSALYDQEPVRFLRHPEDYTDLFRCGVVFDQASDFLAIRTEKDGADTFSAYAIAPKKVKKGETAFISEVGGDREAIAAALPQILHHCNANSLTVHASRHDSKLWNNLGLAGPSRKIVPTSGTVRIVNFPQLMERFRPLWNDSKGSRLPDPLSFTENGDTCIFHYGEEAPFAVSRGHAAQILFGRPPGNEKPLLTGAGPELSEALRSFLPVPALWYGLSFV